jgi:hypothetical protein
MRLDTHTFGSGERGELIESVMPPQHSTLELMSTYAPTPLNCLTPFNKTKQNDSRPPPPAAPRATAASPRCSWRRPFRAPTATSASARGSWTYRTICSTSGALSVCLFVCLLLLLVVMAACRSVGGGGGGRRLRALSMVDLIRLPTHPCISLSYATAAPTTPTPGTTRTAWRRSTTGRT